MSTVVGVIQEGEIWLGADSMASTDEGYIRNFDAEKIFKNGDYIFAYIGSPRAGQILRPPFKPPKNINDLPDLIYKHYEEHGCLTVDSDDNTIGHNCNFLVVHKNRLYEIYSDFQLNEILTYTAIGHGCYIALGSLFSTEELKYTPKERIDIALKAASRFSNATGPPFVIKKCE